VLTRSETVKDPMLPVLNKSIDIAAALTQMEKKFHSMAQKAMAKADALDKA
jgi:hypothetical protein